MFEALFIFIGLLVILWTHSLYVAYGVFFIVLILTLPGLYSIIFGAPFVISSKQRIEGIMNLGDFKEHYKVVELGCGDGRIINKVAKRGVSEAIGYEFSFPTYLVAAGRKYFSKGKEKIHFKNFWKQNFSDTDVIICFLMGNAMCRFEKEIWPTLKTGTKVVSNEFQMPNITPTAVDGRVYLYVK